jgi:hypothetical protein
MRCNFVKACFLILCSYWCNFHILWVHNSCIAVMIVEETTRSESALQAVDIIFTTLRFGFELERFSFQI